MGKELKDHPIPPPCYVIVWRRVSNSELIKKKEGCFVLQNTAAMQNSD